MIKFVYILISFAIVVSFTGCIQSVVKLVLKNDGTGLIEEKIMMKKSFLNFYKEFEKSKSNSITGKVVDFYNDDQFIEHSKSFGDDVSYESHNIIINDKWEGYSAVYSFKDVSKIKLGMFTQWDACELGISDSISEILEARYYFNFNKRDISELIIDCPDSEIATNQHNQNERTENEKKDDKEEEDILKLMKAAYKDLIIKVSIEVEGNINNTNASYVNESEITLFLLDVNEMVKNEECSNEYFNEFLDREGNSIYNLIELFNKCPTMKLEVDKMLKINFK